MEGKTTQSVQQSVCLPSRSSALGRGRPCLTSTGQVYMAEPRWREQFMLHSTGSLEADRAGQRCPMLQLLAHLPSLHSSSPAFLRKSLPSPLPSWPACRSFPAASPTFALAGEERTRSTARCFHPGEAETGMRPGSQVGPAWPPLPPARSRSKQEVWGRWERPR